MTLNQMFDQMFPMTDPRSIAIRHTERLLSDAMDLLLQVVDGPTDVDWWKHKAAKLLNEHYNDRQRCPVHYCQHCRDELTAAKYYGDEA